MTVPVVTGAATGIGRDSLIGRRSLLVRRFRFAVSSGGNESGMSLPDDSSPDRELLARAAQYDCTWGRSHPWGYAGDEASVRGRPGES
jgi:hypothetical protein